MAQNAYRAAAVVFFSRHDDGTVDKVLLALEERCIASGRFCEERKVSASFLGLEEQGKVTKCDTEIL